MHVRVHWTIKLLVHLFFESLWPFFSSIFFQCWYQRNDKLSPPKYTPILYIKDKLNSGRSNLQYLALICLIHKSRCMMFELIVCSPLASGNLEWLLSRRVDRVFIGWVKIKLSLYYLSVSTDFTFTLVGKYTNVQFMLRVMITLPSIVFLIYESNAYDTQQGKDNTILTVY